MCHAPFNCINLSLVLLSVSGQCLRWLFVTVFLVVPFICWAIREKYILLLEYQQLSSHLEKKNQNLLESLFGVKNMNYWQSMELFWHSLICNRHPFTLHVLDMFATLKETGYIPIWCKTLQMCYCHVVNLKSHLNKKWRNLLDKSEHYPECVETSEYSEMHTFMIHPVRLSIPSPLCTQTHKLCSSH